MYPIPTLWLIGFRTCKHFKRGDMTEMAPDNTFGLWFLFKYAIIAFALLYFIFSLIVMRQINLMTQTLVTAVAPVIKTLGIVHALFALLMVIVLFFVM